MSVSRNLAAPAPGTILSPVGCSLPIPDRVRALGRPGSAWERAARLAPGLYLLQSPGRETRRVMLEPGRVATLRES